MRMIARVLVFVLTAQLAGLAGQRVDQFQKVKLMVNAGEKAVPTNVTLRLEESQLVVRSGASDLKVFPYSAIKSAEYSYSKSPRWKSGIGVAVAAGIFALPLFFMKGKKHWLTVQAQDDFALLQLDKGNYKIILPAFEARTGIKVEAVAEEK